MLHAMHLQHARHTTGLTWLQHVYVLTLCSAVLLLSAFCEKKDRPDLQARSGATGSAGGAALLPASRAVSFHRGS